MNDTVRANGDRDSLGALIARRRPGFALEAAFYRSAEIYARDLERIFMLVYSDHAVIYRFSASRVQQCDMEISWLVNANAVEGRDYDRDRLVWLWDVTSKADKRIIDHNQTGVNSRFYEPGPFSQMERHTENFVQWYLGAIAETA